MDAGGRGKQPIDDRDGTNSAKSAPHVSHAGVNREHAFGVGLRDLFQPAFKDIRLPRVASAEVRTSEMTLVSRRNIRDRSRHPWSCRRPRPEVACVGDVRAGHWTHL